MTLLNAVLVVMILNIDMHVGQKTILIFGFALLFMERFIEIAKLAFLTQLHLKDNAVKREVLYKVIHLYKYL